MTPYAKAQSPPHLSRAAQSKNNFILQQGFPEPTVATRDRQYSAILFQPRLLGLVFVVGSALQRPSVFFTLSAILWFCVMAPRFNPFNALYNGALAPFTGITLTPSPAPRRFSQFLGGAFCLAIAVSLTMPNVRRWSAYQFRIDPSSGSSAIALRNSSSPSTHR